MRPVAVPTATMSLPTRRDLLRAGAGAGAVLTTGCIGWAGSGGDPAGSPTPTGPPGDCTAGRRRHPVDLSTYDHRRTYRGLAIDAERESGAVAVRLRNVASADRHTGNRRKYAIQHLDDEWRHLLWLPANHGWTDEAVEHAPGEGFTWRFDLDREGLSAEPYRVCAHLREGTHRFAYFGVLEADGATEATEVALTAEFEATYP